jgi:hypothetical protein
MRAEVDRERLAIRLRLKATLPRYQPYASAPYLDRVREWWASLPLARKQRQGCDLCVYVYARG